MDEDLPRRIPTSLSQELRLTEENEPPKSYLFESPSKWHTKVGLPQQASPSPPFSPRGSRTHGRFSGDDDYEDLLFTYPRLYSDLASERDPFFDVRGIPQNPHNTPISQSGRQSETGSWKKDKRSAVSPIRHERQDPLPSVAVASGDNALPPLFNDREKTWRPPKPPKPPFLSGLNIPARREADDATHSVRLKIPKRGDARRSLPENPYRSFPIRASWNLNQPIAAGQASGRPKSSWETKSINPCRYFPRPFTNQELEILGIPLNKGIPFPAPIPTMDKLPLRRGIIKFDKDGAGQCFIDTGSVAKTETTINFAEGLPNTVWRLSQQLTQNIIHYFVPARQGVPKSASNVPASITVPYVSKSEACPVQSEQAQALDSALDSTARAYVLQVRLAFPFFVHRSTKLAAILNSCMSSKLAMTTASLMWSFIYFTVRWLFCLFKVDISVEVWRT